MKISSTDEKILIEKFLKILADAPAFGSAGLTAIFHAGKLQRIEQTRAESLKTEASQ